ncbi:cytochrome P450 [Coprinopsis marcescibilis]|uniref:Cytochrome P450 n=1 Tax=Coprinopsis marcescibilis TaxID=230819 RepID=A0A5C3L5I2_COPMA|nr:cytochrome P450 [Coprinopsis marcescibilis]
MGEMLATALSTFISDLATLFSNLTKGFGDLDLACTSANHALGVINGFPSARKVLLKYWYTQDVNSDYGSWKWVATPVMLYVIGSWVLGVGYIGRWRKRNPRGLPYPPGPRGYPLIGNILDLPRTYQWEAFSEWTGKYGDIIYLEVLKQPILVLNSLKRVEDLLEKRSANYSDRPKAPMLRELMGWKNLMPCMDHNAELRANRKIFNQYFSQSAVQKYRPLQLDSVQLLLNRMAKAPEDVVPHIGHHTSGLVARLMYSIDIDEDTEYMSIVDGMVKAFEEAAIPGRFLVDAFPVLQYVPSWFPGAGFQKFGQQSNELLKKLQIVPFELVKERMTQGASSWCVASDMIERLPPAFDPSREETEVLFRKVASTAHIGGADTTFAALRTFLYAMAAYPEVQRKVQAEIDREVDAGRLPTFGDRERLRYVDAMLKEVLRWVTVIPFALPHVSSEDDEYDGYFIPKGTIVLANSWFAQHNPESYSNPLEFNPERYLNKVTSVPDPAIPAFGYGRRVCPGMYFANETLYIVSVSILATFDVLPLEAGGGMKIIDGPLSGLAQFKCSVKPRAGRV